THPHLCLGEGSHCNLVRGYGYLSVIFNTDEVGADLESYFIHCLNEDIGLAVDCYCLGHCRVLGILVNFCHSTFHMLLGSHLLDIMLIITFSNCDGRVFLDFLGVGTIHGYGAIIMDGLRIIMLDSRTHVILAMDGDLLLALGVIHRHFVITPSSLCTVCLE